MRKRIQWERATKVSDEEFGFYQYPNANHAAAIDFEAYFGFLEGMFDQK